MSNGLKVLTDVLAEMADRGPGEMVDPGDYSVDVTTPAEFAMEIARRLNQRGFYIDEPEWRRRARQQAEEQARKVAKKEAAFATAVPYSGAIAYCQASVMMDRWGFHRCNRRARFVVRRADLKSEHGDGRLAVCRQHAEDPRSHRWIAHSKYEGTNATEPVEEEYQP